MVTAFLPRSPSRAGSVPSFMTFTNGTITANTTTTHRGPCIPTRCYLGKLMVSCETVGSDADGTILFTPYKYDASANTAVALSAAVDLEALTANEGMAITILSTLTQDQRTIDEGDQLYYTIVSNSAAFNTAPVGVRLNVELLALR